MRKLYSVLFSILFTATAFAQVPTNGLVGQYLFTNGSLSSNYGAPYTGTQSTTNVTNVDDRFGAPNNAKDVNPGGWVSFSDVFDDITTGPGAKFTYSFWVYLDNFNNAYKCIFAKATFESTCYYAGRQYTILINPQGQVQLQAFGALTGGHARVDGNTVLSVGEWHHVVISVDMQTLLASLPATTGLTMYVDNVLQTNTVSEIVGVGISTNGMDNGNAPLGFGTYLTVGGSGTESCASSQDIDGKLDDFRIYNRALGADGVDSLFNEACDAAVVNTQPQSQAICTGTASLTCTAQTGTTSEMRWERFNGTTWVDMGIFSPGPTVSVGGIDASLNGPWRVKLTSPCGLVTYSDEAVVAVGGPAFGNTQSGVYQDAYLCSTLGSVELDANAVGVSNTYQWQEYINNVWTDISGATDPTYDATAAGSIRVNVTACGQTETSDAFSIIPVNGHSVVVNGFTSGNGSICLGQSTGMIIQPSLSSTITWSPSGGSLAPNNILTVAPSATTTYTITATSDFGSCPATTTATVTVNDPEPIITENNGMLEVTGGPFTNIQWYLSGNAVGGANQSSYTPTTDGDYTVSVSQNGCNATSDPYAYTGVATGIEDASAIGLKVYPNPFNAEFIIETAELTSVSVMNAVGEVVLSRTVNGRTSIDATHLSAGIYFVREATSGAVMKLVKN